ncbi:methyltransferase domain-containing protein [Alkalibacillus almallahensis]|uniref:methyltransferase domain-containing protein n=1 Tax=Alkalibacillus almallahensis TaxID=1379154 RepID=UPI00142407DF|nr:methyltransferase domain-containing protein [Alkalibacillus almallahensis]NIK11813.1 hypothetical protein [Alkalibacillus almallahensis]
MPTNNYWTNRNNMMYYKYVDFLVKAFGKEANSMIDIGSSNAEYIEGFYWIPYKYTLDVCNPYSSETVIPIVEDFFSYKSNQKFDFVTCLQVLEHIEHPKKFAQKLFDLSNKVLISVPYNWPQGVEEEHVNDPVNLDKLKEWTGRDPLYSIVVREPLRRPDKGIDQRLICFFDDYSQEINYKKVHDNVKELSREERSANYLDTNLIEHNSERLEAMEENLSTLINQQEYYFKLTKEEMTYNRNHSELEEKIRNNEKLEQKVADLRQKVKMNDQKIIKAKKNKQYFLKEYEKILNSTSWKLTAFYRKIGQIFKK